MRKPLLLAAILSGLAYGAPAADALPPARTHTVIGPPCWLYATQHDATSHRYEGAIWGEATSPTGGNVTIRCYITVNNFPAPTGSTPVGSGSGTATTGGPVSFEAQDSDDVRLCAEINGSTQWPCRPSTNTQFPPQEVIDLVKEVVGLVGGLGVCEYLRVVAEETPDPLPGLVDLDEGDGDVYAAGALFLDCPPFEI